MNLPLVSIVVPTYNRREKLSRLIKSILSSEYPQNKLELIIIDDGSSDNTYEKVKKNFSSKNIIIIRNDVNQLVSKARNIGIKKALGEYIFFLDDDVVLERNSIYKLVNFMIKENLKIASPVICYLDNLDIIWSAGLKLNFWTTCGKHVKKGDSFHSLSDISITSDGIPTAFMVHKSVIKVIGMFNNLLFPMHFEELDFFVRVKALGYQFKTVSSTKVLLEYTKGAFLIKPQRLYFEVRNRIVAHKLWCKSYIQYFVATFFSLFMPLFYLFLKLFRYKEKYLQCVSAIFHGIWDAFSMLPKIESYYSSLKKHKSIKYEEKTG